LRNNSGKWKAGGGKKKIRRVSIIRRFMPLIDRRLGNEVRDELSG
jgi:hypothetical protein